MTTTTNSSISSQPSTKLKQRSISNKRKVTMPFHQTAIQALYQFPSTSERDVSPNTVRSGAGVKKVKKMLPSQHQFNNTGYREPTPNRTHNKPQSVSQFKSFLLQNDSQFVEFINSDLLVHILDTQMMKESMISFMASLIKSTGSSGQMQKDNFYVKTRVAV